MKNERKLYICSVCGNIVGLIEDGGGTLACCGQDMELLAPGSTEAADFEFSGAVCSAEFSAGCVE